MKLTLKITEDFALIPTSDEGIDWLYKQTPGDTITVEVVVQKKQRTITQNKSLHLYLSLLADKLNAGGYDVGTTINVPVSFTPDTVKTYMFKPVLTALYPDKKSTTELSTTEIQDVYENLNRMTSEKFGIGLDWPDRFSMMDESMGIK